MTTDDHMVTCDGCGQRVRHEDAIPEEDQPAYWCRGCGLEEEPNSAFANAECAIPLVHNHGTEDGPGLSCREHRIDGKLVGACMLPVRAGEVVGDGRATKRCEACHDTGQVVTRAGDALAEIPCIYCWFRLQREGDER